MEESHDGAIAVAEEVRPLVQLQELKLRERLGQDVEAEAFSLKQMTRVMAALPALIKLGVFASTVSTPTMPSIPHAFATEGFARLQSLYVTLEDDVAPDQVEAVGER
jgi:hypothetical protein